MEAVTYGMVIPEEYRSEVLADIYAAQEVQQGGVGYGDIAVFNRRQVIYMAGAGLPGKDALDNVYLGRFMLCNHWTAQ